MRHGLHRPDRCCIKCRVLNELADDVETMQCKTGTMHLTRRLFTNLEVSNMTRSRERIER